MKKIVCIILVVIICIAISCSGWGKNKWERQVYNIAEEAIEVFDFYYFDKQISAKKAAIKLEDYKEQIDEIINETTYDMELVNRIQLTSISSTVLCLEVAVRFDNPDKLEMRNELAKLVGKKQKIN